MSKTRNTGFLTNVVQYNTQGDITFVSGSTTLLTISSSGEVITTGVISGSNALSSSYSVSSSQAENAALLDNLDSTSFVYTSSFNSYSSSVSGRVSDLESTASVLTSASASFAVVSSSYASASGSLSTRVTTLENTSASFATMSGSIASRVTKIEGNYATTGSNAFNGSQNITGSLTVSQAVIAQTLNVQQVTSSIVYSCGSNIFGCAIGDVQQMTGSVRITGSLNTIGNACITSVCSPSFIGGTISGTTVYGSTVVCSPSICSTTGNNCFAGMTIVSSCLGINTATPAQRLDIGSGHIKLSDGYGLFYGTQTQVYASEASKYVRFDIAGTSGVMFLSGSGNVGIGTTTPSQLLHLQTVLASSSGVGTAIQIESGGAGGDQGWIGVNKGTGNGLEISVENRDIIFNTCATTPFGGTERMRITSGGLVSINQTSSYAIFNVTGIDCGWGEGIVMNPAPNGYSGINFRTEGRTGSCVTCTWQFAKETSASGVGELFSFNKQGLTGGKGYRVDAVQQWKTNGDVVFGFNVGIGTCTPNNTLQVVSSQINGGIYNTNSSGDSIGMIPFQRNNGSDFFGLTRCGQMSIFAFPSCSNVFSIGTQNSSDMIFGTNDVERVRINTSGNVLIGTATTCKGLLRVAGNAEICKTLFFNGGDGNGGAIINALAVAACSTPSYNLTSMFNFNNIANYGAYLFIHTGYNTVTAKNSTVTGIVNNGANQTITILACTLDSGATAPSVHSSSNWCITFCWPNSTNSNTQFIALAG